MLISIGSIILDDVHQRDGTVRRDLMGGGCIHCGMAMRLWCDDVGVLAKHGEDFPLRLERSLKELFAPEGIIPTSFAHTPHFNQMYRSDGTRYETFQTSFEEMEVMLPAPTDLPRSWSALDGVYLHGKKDHVTDWAESLRKRGAKLILWEPIDHFDDPANRQLFIEYARLVDIVSPNLAEIRNLTGRQTLEGIIDFCHQEKFNHLLLRMGSQGVLVMDKQGKHFTVPPYPEKDIIDATGAGNACCGGFLAGLVETSDLKQAAYYANVSASLAMRQFGAVYPLEHGQVLARERLNYFRS